MPLQISEMSEEKPKPLFVCGDCLKIFEFEELLDNHLELCRPTPVEASTKYDDSEENSTLVTNVSNKYHAKVQESHRCDECGKVFQWKTSLTYHLRTHSGQKPYQCGFCPKSFTTASHKKRHERIHTDERPHQCNRCGKAFVTFIPVRKFSTVTSVMNHSPTGVRNPNTSKGYTFEDP